MKSKFILLTAIILFAFAGSMSAQHLPHWHGRDSIPLLHYNDSIHTHADSLPHPGFRPRSAVAFAHRDTLHHMRPDSINRFNRDSIPHPDTTVGGHADTIHPCDSIWRANMPDSLGPGIDTACRHQHRMGKTSAANSRSFDSPVSVMVYPNPMVESTVITIQNASEPVSFILYDATGRLTMMKTELTNGAVTFERGDLISGFYFYEVKQGTSAISKGRLTIQ